jgi:hypothetical protein
MNYPPLEANEKIAIKNILLQQTKTLGWCSIDVLEPLASLCPVSCVQYSTTMSYVMMIQYAVVGKLLLKSKGGTLIPLRVKVTRYV